MKRWMLVGLVGAGLALPAGAQCVLCYRTAHAQQDARSHVLNAGILILGAPPFLILAGFVAFVFRKEQPPEGIAGHKGPPCASERSSDYEALLCYITGGRTFRISGNQISMGTLVRVQHKGQMTIPRTVRSAVGLAAGDMVDVRAIGKEAASARICSS